MRTDLSKYGTFNLFIVMLSTLYFLYRRQPRLVEGAIHASVKLVAAPEAFYPITFAVKLNRTKPSALQAPSTLTATSEPESQVVGLI